MELIYVVFKGILEGLGILVVCYIALCIGIKFLLPYLKRKL